MMPPTSKELMNPDIEHQWLWTPKRSDNQISRLEERTYHAHRDHITKSGQTQIQAAISQGMQKTAGHAGHGNQTAGKTAGQIQGHEQVKLLDEEGEGSKKLDQWV